MSVLICELFDLLFCPIRKLEQCGCFYWKVVIGERREIKHNVNAMQRQVLLHYLKEKMFPWKPKTGSGKSMTYEYAPILFENGATLIIAPLISII